MKLMQLINKVRDTMRGLMHEVAKLLDLMTNGWVRPWHVTAAALIGHLFVVAAIINGLFPQAALLLVVFGLLDAVDGALARYQNTASEAGGLLDATSDRVKEGLVFASIAYWMAITQNEMGVFITVLAYSGAVAVSYIKAKGEVILAQRKQLSAARINRYFASGLLTYDVRTAVIVAALIVNELYIGMALLTVGVWLTAFVRLNKVLQFTVEAEPPKK